MIPINNTTFFLDHRLILDAPVSVRRLSDLRGVFADAAAYEAALQHEDAIIYQVSGVEPAQGDGQLHYGMGLLMPGRIGAEYYMTKGHFHAYRPAAEVYVTLQGTGVMLLENESGESRLAPMHAGGILYVPGYTAHRTINTADVPLIYLGIYPATAGHDYASIAAANFRGVVLAVNGQPTLVQRGGDRAQTD